LPFRAPILNYRAGDSEGKYLTGWLLRAYFLDIMGMSGKTLNINTSGASMAAFIRMNPDRKNHLGRLQKMFLQSRGKANLTPAKFCRLLGAQSNPELLSFFACFAGDVGFQDSDFEPFKLKDWWAFAHKYFNEHGLEPHPAIVAQGLRSLSPES
jgi:hypothetical protein